MSQTFREKIPGRSHGYHKREAYGAPIRRGQTKTKLRNSEIRDLLRVQWKDSLPSWKRTLHWEDHFRKGPYCIMGQGGG